MPRLNSCTEFGGTACRLLALHVNLDGLPVALRSMRTDGAKRLEMVGACPMRWIVRLPSRAAGQVRPEFCQVAGIGKNQVPHPPRQARAALPVWMCEIRFDAVRLCSLRAVGRRSV
jgi:hypothetical protein